MRLSSLGNSINQKDKSLWHVVKFLNLDSKDKSILVFFKSINLCMAIFENSK